MEDRLKKLERDVAQQGYMVLVLMVLVILDTAGLLILWGERGKPDFDHIAVSLTVFQTMFAIAALYGFWALRGLTREKAEETAKEEVAKIVAPVANRAIADFLRTLGGERTISDDDLAKLVEAAGKEDDNGKK
ncbi:hypothetical protein SAMN05444678_10951 [Sphingomonas sp. YR710]|uniref:hypothetical protein n=1 Tax=Sphingomonas sp. YR710 TaxID=1882773 RepID=UPI000887594B|nr:hypothetical protein [Sphingomonas sp. YR710]SDD11277.1 hypothetical protein SAMN05444678_10951 [Sphingomonas sp. YR710]